MREDESRYPLSEKVVGMILSLPNKIIDRILHGRTVYAGPGLEESASLGAGNRVFFYDADKSGILVAEARIGKALSKLPDEVSEYGGKLFLSKDEFEKYLASANHSRDKLLLVLELQEPTEYTKPIKCPFSVRTTAMYLTEDTFGEILAANR